MSRSTALIGALAVVAGVCSQLSAGSMQDTQRFLAAHPGARATTSGDRVVTLTGAPLSRGAGAAQAANEFVRAGVEAFGVGPVDVRVTRVTPLSSGRHTVFVYDQKMDGLPVEHGSLRVLTLAEMENDAFGQREVHRAILARAMLAEKPADGFAPDTVDAQGAVDRVKALAPYADLTDWSPPEMVVYFGAGEMNAPIEPVRAWKFRGAALADRAQARAFTFFVNAADGSLVFARDEVLHANVTGRVVGLATPGSSADGPGNPPVEQGLPAMRVAITGAVPAAYAYTDADGNFSIPWSGSAPVNLQLSVGDAGSGRWVRVLNAAGSELSVSALVTPGQTPTVNIHPAATEETLAQVNAFLQVTRTHDFFKDRAPGFTGLDRQTFAHVQIADQCNAFFNPDDLSVNFFASSALCANTAFSSIINHEYGHVIVDRLGLVQGAFGEGFGDCVSMLMQDDPVIGRGFSKPDGFVRDAPADQVQHPCVDGIHYCGEVLSGVIWRMRTGFGAEYGTADGLDRMRQLFVDWALLTGGGLWRDSAHPATLDEFLALDEDDAIACNGTPHYRIIVDAFSAHGITGAPTIEKRARIALPVGAPQHIMANQPWLLLAHITPGSAAILPGTARVLVRTGDQGPFTIAPMAPYGTDLYLATLEPLNCGQTAQYSFAVDTSGGTVVYPGQPCSIVSWFTAGAADALAVHAYSFDATADGWTTQITNLGPDSVAAAGVWEWAMPEASWWTDREPPRQLAPERDGNPSPGGAAFVTQRTRLTGGDWDAFDVDDARVTLTSPVWDLAGAQAVDISYTRWFVNGVSEDGSDRQDPFRVEVTTDGDAATPTWADFEALGPGSSTDPNTNAGWIAVAARLEEKGLAPSSAVRLRFTAEDAPDSPDNPGGPVEAAVDEVTITALVCLPCDGIDFNNDGVSPDTSDIFDFLRVFAGADCPTQSCNDVDFNNDGVFPDTIDAFDFLRVFAEGSC